VSASLNACLAAAPVGATWNGEGATYIVNEGISVPHAMTLTDATLVDQTAWANLPTLHMAPIITVNRVNDVTLSDLMIYAPIPLSEPGGGTRPARPASGCVPPNNVTITQVQTFNTWGDGLETTRNSDVSRLDNLPVMYLNVEGFTSTNAGRDCFTGSELQDSWVKRHHLHQQCANGDQLRDRLAHQRERQRHHLQLQRSSHQYHRVCLRPDRT